MKTGLKVLAAALATGVCGFVPGSASAFSGPPSPTTPFYQNYDITLGDYAVSDLGLFQLAVPPSGAPGWQGITGFDADADTTTSVADPVLHTWPIIDNILIGLTSGLPGDAPGQQHLVLFTNNSFAAGAAGVSFGTLFPDTDEDTLISDLGIIDSDSASGDAVDNAFTDLFTFLGGDATTGPDGDIGFGSTDSFTAIAFSGGQVIGTGQAYQTPAPSPVPEPASWTLLLFAGAVLGSLRRVTRCGNRAAS